MGRPKGSVNIALTGKELFVREIAGSNCVTRDALRDSIRRAIQKRDVNERANVLHADFGKRARVAGGRIEDDRVIILLKSGDAFSVGYRTTSWHPVAISDNYETF